MDIEGAKKEKGNPHVTCFLSKWKQIQTGVTCAITLSF